MKQKAQTPANGVTKLATQVRRKPAKQAPVTQHPLFPAMVALWFGALFGLGSVALRPSLLESLVLSLSLDVLLPAAAPPLGLKFRLILALVMAATGVGMGAILARRLARAKTVAVPRRRGFGANFSGRQLRAAAVDEAEQAAPRRRPLTLATDEGPGFHYDAAPLPGGSPAILDVTQIDLSPVTEAEPDPGEADVFALRDEAPLDLDGFVAARYGQSAPVEEIPVEAIVAPAADEPVAAFSPEPEAHHQVFRMPEPAQDSDLAGEEPQPLPPPLSFHPPVDAFAQAEEMPLELGAEQVVAEFGEPAVEDEADDYARVLAGLRVAGNPEVAASSEIAPDVRFDEPQTALPVAPAWLTGNVPVEVEPAPQPSGLFAARSDRRIETAQLAELSPVELIERLALAMRQRAHQGPMSEVLADAVASLATFSPAAALPSEPEAPPPLAKRLELPAALRPIDFDDYVDHDDAAGLALPPRSFAAPVAVAPPPPEPQAVIGEAAPPPVADMPEAFVPQAEAEVPEDSYSSLLDLGRPGLLRQDFVRIEEPEEDSAAIEPVVIFPGHTARPGTRFAAPDAAGQSPAASEPAAPESAPADAGMPQLRRFDAPSATAAPGAAAGGGLRQDPEEAQRALRSALATLQRMSGAA